MSDYLLQHGTRRTPQFEPIRDDQVENSAGGFVWAIDKWQQLNRFLVLGAEGGSYYVSERDLTFKNVQSVRACTAEDGPRTVRTVVDVSQAGRAPKNDPALYGLATCISLGDNPTKRAAAEALPLVARTATHLYHFVAYAETMRGWGRTLRWAVANWYQRNPDQVALQAVKYRQRDGWSHRDLLRLAHPKTADASLAALYDWIVGRGNEQELPNIVNGFTAAQAATSAKQSAALVREFNLPREAVQPEHLNDKDVWAALLDVKMPLTAMVRNLATMTRVGVLDSQDYRAVVRDALADKAIIKGSRLHPLTLLVGLRTYASGHGFRGTNTWHPKPDIIDALDEAFYLAFDNVEPTGKSHLLALDVSGSMGMGNVAGSPLTPREASAALALVTLHAERDVEVVGFSSAGGWSSGNDRRGYGYRSNDGITPLPLSRRQRLDDAVRSISGIPFGGTDCALPMLYATAKNLDIDAFVIYTDSETWAGAVHPKQALDQYRANGHPNARSVVVGMVANSFSIADPSDPGQLDVVGMDTATPALISEFVAGNL